MINISELRRSNARFLDSLTVVVVSSLERFGGRVLDAIQSGTGVGFTPRTGKLQAGTKYKVTPISKGMRLTFTNSVKYAQPIEFGSKRHDIFARRAPLLVFFWPKLGKMMFLKRVDHPGNRAYSFLRLTIHRFRQSFVSGIIQAGANIASRF